MGDRNGYHGGVGRGRAQQIGDRNRYYGGIGRRHGDGRKGQNQENRVGGSRFGRGGGMRNFSSGRFRGGRGGPFKFGNNNCDENENVFGFGIRKYSGPMQMFNETMRMLKTDVPTIAENLYVSSLSALKILASSHEIYLNNHYIIRDFVNYLAEEFGNHLRTWFISSERLNRNHYSWYLSRKNFILFAHHVGRFILEIRKISNYREIGVKMEEIKRKLPPTTQPKSPYEDHPSLFEYKRTFGGLSFEQQVDYIMILK